MKRYWLFAFDNFYPYGGMQDFYGDYDSVEECHQGFKDQPMPEYQIFDSKERVVLFDSNLPKKYQVHGGKLDSLGDEWQKTEERLNKLYPISLWLNSK